MEKPDSRVRTTRRIRLLWLIDSLTMGGAERLVAAFARHLDRERFDLRVICLKVIDSNPLAADIEAIGIPVTVLGARNLRDIAAFARLVHFVWDQKIDVIHTHLTYADIWGRLAGWLTRRPVFSTVHVPQFFNYLNPRRRDQMIEAIAMFTRKHFGGTVISVSEALRQHHISQGFPADRIITIHNGIELSKFEPPVDFSKSAKRSELGITIKAPVVITLAVLREGKGHDTLLDAVPKVLENMPETKFLIVGGGPLEEELRQRVNQSGVSESVIFTGMRQDTAEMLAVADLFVLPSEFDPLPTVVLEAMVMRLPVVGLDSGGVPEMVVDGQTGLLLQSTDPAVVAQSILSLLTNTEQAKQMGEQGRARLEAEFSASVWVRKLESLYDKVLSGEKTATEGHLNRSVENRRKRVYMVEFLGRGGMIHYTYQLCRALATLGVNVKLITDQNYELADRPHNFAVERIFNLWNPRPTGQVEWSRSITARLARFLRRIGRGFMYYHEWWKLIRHLGREQPDVVQFGEIRFATDLIPLLLLRLSGLRLADICHNVAPFDTRLSSTSLVKVSFLHRVIYSWIYRCFYTIFVHSEASRLDFLRMYGGGPNKIHVIPHGNEQLFLESVNTIVQDGLLRLKLNLSENAPVALFFGTLTKYKGVEYLLGAFAEVRRTLPMARLIIAGYPNPDVDISALYRQAKELEISESVIFHLQYIPNEEVAAFFSLADVVVFPYLMVYQSGALQVAYSFGKPVVATSVGGLPEVVKHGQTGLLVPPHDSGALAEALITLLSDKHLSRRLGQRALELSKTNHSWDRIAYQIQQSYSLYSG